MFRKTLSNLNGTFFDPRRNFNLKFFLLSDSNGFSSITQNLRFIDIVDLDPGFLTAIRPIILGLG